MLADADLMSSGDADDNALPILEFDNHNDDDDKRTNSVAIEPIL